MEPRDLLIDGRISITCDDYEKVLQSLGWNNWPRSVGDPRQQYAYDTWHAYRFLTTVNHTPEPGEKRTAFISHNRFSKNQAGNKVLPTAIEVGCLMFDFDSGKLSKTHKDAKNLYTYLKKQGVPAVALFTGSKGFHIHAKLRPMNFRFHYQDNSAESLKTIVRQIQRFLKEKCKLETLDEQVVGEPKKLARLPYSWHVSRIGVNSKRICVPLLEDQLMKWDIDQIVEYSQNPKLLVPKTAEPKETILELANRLKLKEAIANEHLEWSEKRDTIVELEGELEGVLALFKKKCPGWHQDLFDESRNPMHPTRAGFCLVMKQLGYGAHDVDAMWEKLSVQLDYIDRENREYRLEQILSLFQPRYRKPASCTTIKRQRRGDKSLCIGPDCPRYKEMDE